jgi:hypothetical protein
MTDPTRPRGLLRRLRRALGETLPAPPDEPAEFDDTVPEAARAERRLLRIRLGMLEKKGRGGYR